MTKVIPYLIFEGTCEEAFRFYKSIFGGDFSYIGRYKEAPESANFNVSEADREKIMHITLPIGNETVLMGSDVLGDAEVVRGNGFSITVDVDKLEEAKRIFHSLAQGGRINQPFRETFWGAFFGAVTDKFGVHWMVNCYIK